MASTISMSYISSVILVALAIQATNSAVAAKMSKINPSGSRFQPGKVHKIIGGTPATLGEIPYQVEILRNDNYWCSGSLVTATFVVTAANCIDTGISENELKVRAGHISHSIPGSTAQTKAVKNIKVHEMWNRENFRNDIGVLELSSAMQINQFVKTIAVPCQECPIGASVNQVLLASGWGETENDNRAPVLMKVNLKVFSQTKCNEMWGGIIKSGMICAGTIGNNTCSGDHGAPLATTSGVKTLVGLASVVTCTNDFRSIFTRVHKYSDWIDANT